MVGEIEQECNAMWRKIIPHKYGMGKGSGTEEGHKEKDV